MTHPRPSPLISSHPSTSGLQIALHPLALLTISDYITRHTLRNGTGPIIGALLGTQEGREISIESAYEVLVNMKGDEVKIDPEWFENKLRLFKETHPTQDLLGWFSTTTSPTYSPAPYMVSLHQELLANNESLILLCLNASPAGSIGGGGKLPLAIYESIYEAEEADGNSQEQPGSLKLKFVPLKYTIETGEAEMIGVDFVAKGGFGNAAAEATGLENEPKKEAMDEDTAGVEKKDKGKEKDSSLMAALTATMTGEVKGEIVHAGTQNDELLSNLTAKSNAIRMLHSRISLLTKYLSNPPDPSHPNHTLLRSIKSLTHSRLALLTPPDSAAFKEEQLAEQSDVNLVALLGTLTRSIEEVRSVGKKFAGTEAYNKVRSLESQLEVPQRRGRGAAGGMAY
ncbi:hypothetical protein RUND412_007618 [Rhizina undulata]